jgi:hypothetical protein
VVFGGQHQILAEKEGEEMSKWVVWGLASGRAGTEGAARGALAWREYDKRPTMETLKKDWVMTLKIQKIEEPRRGT